MSELSSWKSVIADQRGKQLPIHADRLVRGEASSDGGIALQASSDAKLRCRRTRRRCAPAENSATAPGRFRPEPLLNWNSLGMRI